MRETDGTMKFPVPWAATPEMSFVETSAAYGELLRSAGFAIVSQRNRRDFALAFFAKMREAPPPFGLPIVMGPSAPVKVGNLVSMIESGVLSPNEIISRKL